MAKPLPESFADDLAFKALSCYESLQGDKKKEFCTKKDIFIGEKSVRFEFLFKEPGLNRNSWSLEISSFGCKVIFELAEGKIKRENRMSRYHKILEDDLELFLQEINGLLGKKVKPVQQVTAAEPLAKNERGRLN